MLQDFRSAYTIVYVRTTLFRVIQHKTITKSLSLLLIFNNKYLSNGLLFETCSENRFYWNKRLWKPIPVDNHLFKVYIRDTITMSLAIFLTPLMLTLNNKTVTPTFSPTFKALRVVHKVKRTDIQVIWHALKESKWWSPAG